MLKKQSLYVAAISIVLFVLCVLGSLWDYEIATAVYIGQSPSENLFGIVFAFIGIAPTFVGWSFLGASILCISRNGDIGKKKRGYFTALSVLLFVLSFFYFCNTLLMVNGDSLPVHWAVAYSVGIAIIFLAAIAGFKLTKGSKDTKLLAKILFLTLVSLITMIIIMSTKEIMNRPRFRWVLETENHEYFLSWWQNGRQLKEASGEALSDEFSSFPSGHSAYSMFAIFLFPTLADFIKGLEKYRGLLFASGFIWWALTALSRMTVGAHYLTDVAFAGAVTVFAYAAVKLVCHLITRRKHSLKADSQP